MWTIAAEDIAVEAQNHAADRPEKAWTAAAEALVIREALLQKAAAIGLVAKPKTNGSDQKEAEADALIPSIAGSRSECARTPMRHPADAISSRINPVSNRQNCSMLLTILLQADKRDALAFARTRKEAAALLEAVLKKASPVRADGTRNVAIAHLPMRGGRLGQISAWSDHHHFLNRRYVRLIRGEISPEPVETPYGFHIIRLDHKAEGRIPEFEAAQPLVAEFLGDASWRRAVSQFISLVLGEAEITGVALKGATSPLVQ